MRTAFFYSITFASHVCSKTTETRVWQSLTYRYERRSFSSWYFWPSSSPPQWRPVRSRPFCTRRCWGDATGPESPPRGISWRTTLVDVLTGKYAELITYFKAIHMSCKQTRACFDYLTGEITKLMARFKEKHVSFKQTRVSILTWFVQLYLQSNLLHGVLAFVQFIPRLVHRSEPWKKGYSSAQGQFSRIVGRI